MHALASVFKKAIKGGAILGVVSFFLLFTINSYSVSSEALLARKIKSIEKQSNVVMGLTAVYIEKNKLIDHQGAQRFFMASTVKFPIALAFLHRVDQKKESLHRSIKMTVHNSVPGSGSLYYLFEKKAINISLQQILKYMLRDSDNSASDTLLQVVHGPHYVAQQLRHWGFKNIFINRSILEIMLFTNHVDPVFSRKHQPVYAWKKLFNGVPIAAKKAAWERFETDTRDTTTSYDMAMLLTKFYRKQIISAESTQLLMNIMEQCRTGRSRIRGLLPPHVKVAHKTGTWGIDELQYIRYPGVQKLYRFVSDVGIITLPHNKGHIAIAVYVKSKAASNYSRSRAIALASRAVYDHFMAL